MRQFNNRTGSAVAVLLAAGLIASAANAAYPPFRGADTAAPPPAAKAPSASCTATGTWVDSDTSGTGSWTRTAKKKCTVPGVWTDAYGYTWTVKKGPSKTLTGSVNYNGI